MTNNYRCKVHSQSDKKTKEHSICLIIIRILDVWFDWIEIWKRTIFWFHFMDEKITVQSFKSTILLTILSIWKPYSKFCTRSTPIFCSIRGKKEMSTRQSEYYKLKKIQENWFSFGTYSPESPYVLLRSIWSFIIVSRSDVLD